MNTAHNHRAERQTCPYCGSKSIAKAGTRKLKREAVQRFRCDSCLKYFTDRKVRNVEYPARLILNAVSIYNLGRTLERTKMEMARRFHTRVPESTIHSWIKEYSEICRFARLREQAIKLCTKPEEMVFTRSLNHRQIYNFQLHRAKLLLQSGELPPRKFLLLKAYLEKIPTDAFPHAIFQPKTQDETEGLSRSSQMKFDTLGFVKAEKQNMANRLAGLGLLLAKTNKERHEAIQEFMITNDSVTVACEVPVYLTDADIGYFKSKGFTLDFEDNCQTPITGHIDVLQIRNGLIHVLDYKPEADKANASNQLTIYALALASRTNLAVRDIKFAFRQTRSEGQEVEARTCAWFDDKNCFEFFPLHAVYRKNAI